VKIGPASYHAPGSRRLGGQIPIALFYLWLVGIALVIVGSLLPSDSDPMLELDLMMTYLSINDKIVHSLGYASLALIPPLLFSWRRMLAVVFSLSALGLLLEFAQKLVPGRTCDMADFLANNIGLALGTTLGLLAARIVSCFGRPSSSHR
jgi:VanZ family protein